MTTLANRWRPKKFSEVVGQDGEVEVMVRMLEKGWRPPAVMLVGPHGTGKTTLARLLARAIFCDMKPEDKEGPEYEPCGVCDDCRAMDRDNHSNYIEVDAASQGLVDNVRAMKDLVSYRAGSKMRVVYWDESHMLTKAAQNALLQSLEEGVKDVVFVFATTEEQKMLPTVRSRCVVLEMKLLRANQVADRLREIAEKEGIDLADRAASIIGSYTRGHIRDAIILLETLSRVSPEGVSEELTRTYLRLDQFDEIYRLLVEPDKKEAIQQLEQLLCNYAPADLAEITGQVLLNAYKVTLGIRDFTEVDVGWLEKVVEARGSAILDEAEGLLSLHTDYSTLHYAMAAFANVLLEGKTSTEKIGAKRGLVPSRGRSEVRSLPTPNNAGPAGLRKPGREIVDLSIQEAE